jgi:hypothetical protein
MAICLLSYFVALVREWLPKCACDLEGYRIDALFRDLNPDIPNRIVRIGKTAYAPMR